MPLDRDGWTQAILASARDIHTSLGGDPADEFSEGEVRGFGMLADAVLSLVAREVEAEKEKACSIVEYSVASRSLREMLCGRIRDGHEQHTNSAPHPAPQGEK